MTTTLVTGASGQLGRLVVEALLDRGADPATLVATARDTAALQDLADRGVQLRTADYDDAASLDSAFAGVDRLLLVSGNAVGQRLQQHTNAVGAAARAGVDLVVYTSSPHADTAGYAIAREHRATEQLLADSGLAHVVLRNGWYVENYTGNLGPVLATGTVTGAAGDGRVSAATRRDLAEAAAVVLLEDGHAGLVYELGGDEPFTMTELAAEIGRATGREITYADLEPTAYADVLAGAGVPRPFAEVLADSDVALSRGELLDESGTLSRLLGRPTASWREAVRVAVAGQQAGQ